MLMLAALCASWAQAGAEPRAAGRPVGPPVVPVESVPAVRSAAPPGAPERSPVATAAVSVRPGVNQVVRVSAGHLNRIVTPFRHPQVRTTAGNLTTEVSGPVVYVSGPPERPATLFITEKGSEEVALSLTLVPDAVAPRQIRLDVIGADGAPLRMSGAQTDAERAYPYPEAIKRLLRELALGRVPAGYALAAGAPPAPPYCRQQGVSFDFAQAMEGQRFQVVVGRATNVSADPLEIFDDACLTEPRVAAVAAWPSVLIGPGERTEVYVVLRELPAAASAGAERPSLLDEPAPTAQDAAASPGGWAVQVAALSTEQGARELVSRLRADGYPAGFYTGPDGLHYVRIGWYPDSSEAAAIADRLRAPGLDPLLVRREGDADE